MFVYCILVAISSAAGKTVSGFFRSNVARENYGQYITRFLYHGANGVLTYRVDDVQAAVQKEGKLLLFEGTESLDDFGCQERLASAQMSINLSYEEHTQTVPSQTFPQMWRMMYVDRFTCHDEQIKSVMQDVKYQITMLNSDAAGNPLDHFSAEEAGLHNFYFLLMLCYFLASCIYLQPLWRAVKKAGPMHIVLKVLSIALLLQGASVLLNYIHMTRFAHDGVGSPLTRCLAHLCDTATQVQMLYMLLSLCVGWRHSTKNQRKPLLWDSGLGSTGLTLTTVIIQGSLLIWEQIDQSDAVSGVGWSTPGLLLILLHVSLVLFLALILFQIICAERSTLKRDFYLTFTRGCFLWLLCHPVLVLFSVVLNEHQRDKVVIIGVILCRSISVVVLYRLFLSHSLYWEVSTLSSISLPLTVNRMQRGRY